MFDHHRLHLINFTLTKELSQFYFFIVLRSLAVSMISIFIPIYLINDLNYKLADILSFYAVLFVFFGLITPLAVKASHKIGFKHLMFISLFPQLLFLFLLNQLNTTNIPLFILAFVSGAAEGLFWISFHLNFAYCTDKKHRSEEIGVWYILATIIGIIGPFLGGLILTLYNFHVLFILVTVLLTLSMIPLFFSEDIYKVTAIKWNKILDYSKTKESVRFLAYGCKLIGAGIFWPVFIFFSLYGYLSTGFIISFSSFALIFITWLIGRISDGFDKNLLVKIGALFESITWLIKLIVKTFSQILLIGILGDIAYTIVDIPFTARVYDMARKTKPVEYLIFREIFLVAGKIIGLAVIALTINNLGFMASIKTSFIASAVASFIQIFV